MQRRLLMNSIFLAFVLWVHPIVGFALVFVYGLFQSYRFYEIIIFGMIIDVVYHTNYELWVLSLPIYTILGIFLLILGSRIQEKINFYV